MGVARAEPSLDEGLAARGLLARLVAEGAAVPLNLLGANGAAGTDSPDFVVSAPAFSYIFTLRGNKAWKQPPVTSGAVKVSPLALATYELLAQKVTLSAYDLATQLGKEVTEAAVLRALTELWSQLRVLPVLQQDGSATLWELSTARFTKQIKAGANAGQPSALSALISLYLGQAIAATEDEIETFLSPLAPRSRVRDVIHALLGARQLETFVVEGKTLLHVSGELPAFASAAARVEPSAELVEPLAAAANDGSRIRKFTPKAGSKIGTGLRVKPSFGAGPGAGVRAGKPAGDRERRPFKRAGDSSSAFNRPWNEDRAARSPHQGAEQGGESQRTFTPRPARPFGDRPSGGGSRPGSFAGKPRQDDRGDSGSRKTFSKPGTFARKREGSAGRPAPGGTQRGERRDDRAPQQESGEVAGRPSFSDRRPSFPDRAERPSGASFKRPGSKSPSFGFKGKPGFDRKASSASKPAFTREAREPSSGEAPRKVFRKFDAPRIPKPFAGKPGVAPRSKFAAKSFQAPSGRPERGSTGERPSRSSTSRPSSDRAFSGAGPAGKPFGARKPFAGKGGPFAKFADGKKPFRKPGPGKPSAAKPAHGGFAPTRRKRSEDEA